MVSIRGDETGPILKPTPKPKKAPTGLARGGKKPKEAGRRYERHFADKYDMHRQVGSGAFGVVDPSLVGDITGEIGRLKLLFEAKSWHQVDGRGEKVVTFSVALLDKIAREAEQLGRVPLFIYHVKGATDEWAVIKYDWLHEILGNLENEIAELTLQLEEALNGGDE